MFMLTKMIKKEVKVIRFYGILGLALMLAIPVPVSFAEEPAQLKIDDTNRPAIQVQKPIASVPAGPEKPATSETFLASGALTPPSSEAAANPSSGASTSSNSSTTTAMVVKTAEKTVETTSWETPISLPLKLVVDINGKKAVVDIKQLITGMKDAAIAARKRSGVFCIEGCGDAEDLYLLPGVKELFTREELQKYSRIGNGIPPSPKPATGTNTLPLTDASKNGTLTKMPPIIWTAPKYSEKAWLEFGIELMRRMDKKGISIFEPIIVRPLPMPVPNPDKTTAGTTASSATASSNLTGMVYMPPYYRTNIVSVAKIVRFLWTGSKSRIVPLPMPTPQPWPGNPTK